ncbi:MAG: hypothetical protein LJE67_00235 [Salaquimonas sp.]|nr:hypothetical protein [Salaquimonas sp.]
MMVRALIGYQIVEVCEIARPIRQNHAMIGKSEVRHPIPSGNMNTEKQMTKLRKSIATALAFATLSTAGVFAPVAANAGGYGYYNPGNGFYGPPPHYGYGYRPPNCFWQRYRYRDPYSGYWVWGRRWVCR